MTTLSPLGRLAPHSSHSLWADQQFVWFSVAGALGLVLGLAEAIRSTVSTASYLVLVSHTILCRVTFVTVKEETEDDTGEKGKTGGGISAPSE